jgi:hypothetical protein
LSKLEYILKQPSWNRGSTLLDNKPEVEEKENKINAGWALIENPLPRLISLPNYSKNSPRVYLTFRKYYV